MSQLKPGFRDKRVENVKQLKNKQKDSGPIQKNPSVSQKIAETII